MGIAAETLVKKANETLGTNVCLYDAAGNPFLLSTGLPVIGTTTPSDAESNPTNAINTSAKISAWDAASQKWNKVRSVNTGQLITTLYNASGTAIGSGGGTSDGISLGTGLIAYIGGYAWNGSGWDRIRSVNTGQLVITMKSSSGTEPAIANPNADGQAVSATGLLVNNRNYGYNAWSNVWDRLRAVNTGQLVVSWKDSSGNEPLDSPTAAVKSIANEHHEIHEGNKYTAGHTATAIASGATFDFLFVAPNTTKRCHLTWAWLNWNNGVTLQIYEGTTVSSNGTSLTTFNHERNSGNSATGLAFHTPTVTTVGTVCYPSIYSPAGIKMSAENRSEHEYVAKQNTKYLFRFTNDTGATANINFFFDWYEL